MHNPVVLESGCKGPFYSNKWFWSVISHFISFSFKLSISFCLYLFRDCSFLSLRDPRKTELLQMRLSVGCCRSCFPASFSCEGRGGGGEALFRALKPCVTNPSMKAYTYASRMCMKHTHDAYTELPMCPPLDRIV